MRKKILKLILLCELISYPAILVYSGYITAELGVIITMGILFTIVLEIQFTISTERNRGSTWARARGCTPWEAS